MKNHLDFVRSLIPVVKEAGEIELKYYHAGAEVIDKADGSPVTLADQEAEKLVAEALHRLAPGIPMVGEESVAAGVIPDISAGTFFLVDPLDGTRDFITGGGEFTVNIALLENFIPVLGIIYAPVSGELYYAAEGKAFRGSAEVISVRKAPEEGLTVMESKRHGDPQKLDDFLKGRKVAGRLKCSSSLKFCRIAAGEADLYYRSGPTSEWDTAAGEAILRAAGGQVTRMDGTPMQYGKFERKFLNPEFVAFV